MRTRTPANQPSATQDILTRLKQSYEDFDSKQALVKTKESLKNTGERIISVSGREIGDLITNQNTPNYKVSAYSSALLALLYMTTSLEGGYYSSYLALAGAAGEAFLAGQQYGFNKIAEQGTQAVLNLFKSQPKQDEVNLVNMEEATYKVKKSM